MAIFGERLKLALQNKNMKQSVLAYRLNVDRSYITNWINGKYNPTPETQERIANILGVSRGWLLGFEEKPQHTFISYAPEREELGLRKDIANRMRKLENAPEALGLSEGEQKLVELFRSASPYQQEIILQLLEAKITPKE